MRALLLACLVAAMNAEAIEPEEVDVFIGTRGLGHVTPAACAPFGMVQAGPDTSIEKAYRSDWAHTSGYQHDDGWIWRFSQTHLSGTGCRSLGDFGLMVYPAGFDAKNEPVAMVRGSELASPGTYSVRYRAGEADVSCDIAALPHSALYRFRTEPGCSSCLLLDLDWSMGRPGKGDCWGRYVVASSCRFPSPMQAEGGRRVMNWNAYELHFAAEFSQPVRKVEHLRTGDGLRGDIYELDFGALPGGILEVRLGLSASSTLAAVRNLRAELPAFGYESARTNAQNGWRQVLSRVSVASARDPAVAASFRAALYRSMLQPNDWGDVGGSSAYTTLSLWDTFRAAHPLYTLVVPERVDGFINSMLDQCDRQGYLPIWGLGKGENHCMIGHHAVPVIVDAYLKGFRGFDAERAWRAVRQSLTVNHHPAGDGTWGLTKEDWDILDRYGYYPYDKMRGAYGADRVRGESVARTLECAYDDACAERLATALGKQEDAAFFAHRAVNWKNVFDPSTGFARGKGADGKWREPFDPYALGGGPWTDNDFCEGNAWQYTWHVMQDPHGLIAAFGGRQAFIEKLKWLFEQPEHMYEDRPTGDVTGLIGQYAHGNEPSHHVAYFFTLAGRQDFTAKYVRQIFDTQYFARDDGLCGNDDCGQMGAWYVFSALGFYPFDPCGGDYVLGAPQVERAALSLPNGKVFQIEARGLSKKNKFVRTVTLNGRELKGGILRHREILAGGTLIFDMVGK